MKRRKPRRQPTDVSLSITSIMDMMTIILVFLLKSYGTDEIAVSPNLALDVPVSTSGVVPRLAVRITITREEIIVDGDRISELERRIDPGSGREIWLLPEGRTEGRRVSALYDVLVGKANRARQDPIAEFQGEVLVQVDKRIPFGLLGDVMFTAGEAGFGTFRFVVISSTRG